MSVVEGFADSDVTMMIYWGSVLTVEWVAFVAETVKVAINLDSGSPRHSTNYLGLQDWNYQTSAESLFDCLMVVTFTKGFADVANFAVEQINTHDSAQRKE